jgi:hypothetical protein
MANRVGRPRTQIDNGEVIAKFARMSSEDRAFLLAVLAGIHDGLEAAKQKPEEGEAQG